MEIVKIWQDQNIIDFAQNYVEMFTKDRIAVFLIEAVINGKKEKTGVLKEIDMAPAKFDLADEITITVVLSDEKDPMVMKFCYE